MASDGNLEHWEMLASFHGTGQDDYYDIPALIRGDMSLRPVERAGIDIALAGREMAGLRVAHVQSHIGIDSVHLARLGARVTAFDFSPMALRRLRDLAAECGVDIATVVADSQELASDEHRSWHGRFDIVYATIGVICWIADLEAWMQGVAALLKPGGRLLLLELHPLYNMGDSFEPLVLDFPYVNDGPRHFEGSGSYANPDADLPWSIEEYAWSIGETVNAAIHAGLTIVRLDEHVESAADPRGDCMTREPDGLYRLRAGRGAEGRPPEPLPVLYTLVAAKPGPRGNLSEDEPAG
jgi:SAM-dependent methyltransferase